MTTATLTRTPPHHNTLTCYTDYRCRLPECVARYNERSNQRVRAQKAGTWNGLVDAEPVRQHILALQAVGIGAYIIAATVNVRVQAIYDFLGSRGKRGRKHRTTPELAAKILAISPDSTLAGRIDATGTVRRLRALTANGWPGKHIARHAGVNAEHIYVMLRCPDRHPTVLPSTAKAIADTYNTLRTQRPSRHGVSKGHAKQARARAAANRWPATKYWDQHLDLIDDPDFTPQLTRIEEIAEDARWLLATGAGIDDIAQRLDVSSYYIERALRETQPREENAA